MSPFLKKTYDILSNPEYEKVCGWGDNNDSVFIKDVSSVLFIMFFCWFKFLQTRVTSVVCMSCLILLFISLSLSPSVCVQIDEFAKTVLPKYFKHSNYASFKRQLHKVRI